MAKTLFEKIWTTHCVREFDDGTALLYLDRVFLHERTGSIALKSLAEAGRAVANASQVFATMDHIVDTLPGRSDKTLMPSGGEFIRTLRDGAHRSGVTLFDLNDPMQGISHMIAAEQGIALPGLTMVCPDSHTCTLGALGALAFGVGTGDCEHALATEVLRKAKPAQMRVRFDGHLRPGVTAKDLILHLIAREGAGGGKRSAIEFAGPVITQMPMHERFTLCNMAVEFSAFTGIIAPDEKTIRYLKGRRYAPGGGNWSLATESWEKLSSDTDARFDYEIRLDCSDIKPQVTWGTSPEQAHAIGDVVPPLDSFTTGATHKAAEKAQAYMGVTAGQPVEGLEIDGVFIGSCTNARLADLRAAAQLLKGKTIAPGLRALCVPGSTPTRQAAEAEGLHDIFTAAGFEWREAGCSLCFYAGGEGFAPGQRVVSTTNRNFEGRQGPGVRTHLVSPVTAAACALMGKIVAAEDIDE